MHKKQGSIANRFLLILGFVMASFSILGFVAMSDIHHGWGGLIVIPLLFSVSSLVLILVGIRKKKVIACDRCAKVIKGEYIIITNNTTGLSHEYCSETCRDSIAPQPNATLIDTKEDSEKTRLIVIIFIIIIILGFLLF